MLVRAKLNAAMNGEEKPKAFLRWRLGSTPPGARSATRRRARLAHGVSRAPRAAQPPCRNAPADGRGWRYAATLGLDTRRRTGDAHRRQGTPNGPFLLTSIAPTRCAALASCLACVGGA